MSEKILLIDGFSILNRAFYGVPPLSNSKGVPTNAVYGFLNILFKVTDLEEPSYAAVAFDLKAPTFRHVMYNAYKGTRKPMPDELHAQVPVVQEILKAMGIRSVSVEGFEADDIIGSIARKAEKEGKEVLILSGDRDILQLVTENTTLRFPRTSKGMTTIEKYTPEKIAEDYAGIEPLRIIDLKAMMGDSSDNIPGLPGVGEKTALSLLEKYGSLEEAKAHEEEINPKKAFEAFRDHYDLALLSKDLATIRTDVELDLEIEDLKIEDLFNPEAFALIKEYEFKNLYPRFSDSSKNTPDQIVVRLIEQQTEADEFFSAAGKSGAVGLCADIEENTFKGLAAAINGVTVYIKTAESSDADKAGEQLTFFAEESGDPSGISVDFLAEKINELINNNIKTSVYSLKDLFRHVRMAEAYALFDIHIAAYLLDPLKSEYAYDTIASEYGKAALPSAEEIVGSKITRSVTVTEEQKRKISGCKAAAALLSRDGLEKRLTETGMQELFKDIETPLVYTLAEMENLGIRINRDELALYGAKLSDGIEALEREIYEEAGEEFNINSPRQLGVILFEKLGLKGVKKTKSGWSTAADVLEKLAEEAPVVEKILNYRQLTKLKSTYADALGGYCDDNGRIHSTFHQTVTATGRLSSADPNLQNIPVRMDLGREIRRVFVPKEGCVFIDADYSQIELRVMAHLSGDEKLIAAYRNAEDIHAMTASEVFGVPLDQVTSLQRRSAKAVNFGIIYGISSFGLGKGLNISRKEAQEYIEKYFNTYPGVKSFLDNTVAKAKEDGFTTTMFGRIRPIPEFNSSNFMTRQFGERVAMNSQIQGTAADIIKIAMNRVRAALKAGGFQAKLILQVHDELLLEVPEAEADAVEKILKEEMEHAAELRVPLETDLSRGMNWDDAH